MTRAVPIRASLPNWRDGVGEPRAMHRIDRNRRGRARKDRVRCPACNYANKSLEWQCAACGDRLRGSAT